MAFVWSTFICTIYMMFWKELCFCQTFRRGDGPACRGGVRELYKSRKDMLSDFLRAKTKQQWFVHKFRNVSLFEGRNCHYQIKNHTHIQYCFQLPFKKVTIVFRFDVLTCLYFLIKVIKHRYCAKHENTAAV